MKRIINLELLNYLRISKLIKSTKQIVNEYNLLKRKRRSMRKLLLLENHLLRDIGFECRDRTECQPKKLKHLRRLK